MEDYDDSYDDVLASLDIPEKKVEPSTPLPSTSKLIENPQKSTESITKPASSSSSVTSVVIEKPKYSNSIRVHPNQRGNPILKSITNIPWEFDSSIVADYVVGKSACVLFLSIRYHNLKPDYIHERIKLLGKNYELRVLLVQVDIKESQNALKHLTRLCLLADFTLMLAWNAEECGKIIETYKMIENKPAEYLMDKTENDDYQKLRNIKFTFIIRLKKFNFHFLNRLLTLLPV
jgi:DNA excision repair protein ERCC-1